MALWVRVLALKAQGPEFKSQHPLKKQSAAVRAGDANRGGRAEAAQQVRPVQLKTV